MYTKAKNKILIKIAALQNLKGQKIEKKKIIYTLKKLLKQDRGYK